MKQTKYERPTIQVVELRQKQMLMTDSKVEGAGSATLSGYRNNNEDAWAE